MTVFNMHACFCRHARQPHSRPPPDAPHQMRARAAALDTQARAARPATRLPIIWAALSCSRCRGVGYIVSTYCGVAWSDPYILQAMQ